MQLLPMLPPLALVASCSTGERQSDWLAGARFILNHLWDPVGHHGTGYPDDEYDQHRKLLAILMAAGASDDMLLVYLEWAEGEIGQAASVDHRRNTRVVAALRALGVPPRPERIAASQ